MSTEYIESTEETNDLEANHGINSFQPLPMNDDHTDHEKRKLRGISWIHVNFIVNKKVILSDCWGEVSATTESSYFF